MPINTVFQLLADEGSAALAAAERIALVPDLLAFWLSGELANEAHERVDDRPARRAQRRLGARADRAARAAGAAVRRARRAGHAARAACSPTTSWATRRLRRRRPRHRVGVRRPRRCATSTPRSCRAARGRCSGSSCRGRCCERADAKLTNERGVDGTTRLLKNVMGLWLMQECRRAWDAPSYGELHAARRGGAGRRARCSIPTTTRSWRPATCRRGSPPRATAGQPTPRDRGEIVRCDPRLARVQVPLRARAARGRDAAARSRRIHVIGGGARNALLCRLTADVTGREVLAGPVEATALGNVLVQARAAGELGSLADMRAVAAASTPSPSPDRERPTYRRSSTTTRRPPPARRPVTDRRQPPAAARDRDPVVGLRRLGHALRHVPAARPPARRVRARRRRRRGPPPDRHRRRRGAALPVGRGRRLRRAARAHRGARAARRRRQPEPLPGPRLQARLGHASRRRACARRPSRTCSSASRSRRALGSTAQSLWLADGTNYPGQDDLRARRRRLLDALGRVYAAMPADQELLVEYKLFEPAFYATDLADWGSALLVCQKLGERAQVLVDLGHHAQGVNIEQIVAFLADEGRLGGFHFNNRKYADDDLIVGSVNPFELFLIFFELGGAGAAAAADDRPVAQRRGQGRGDGAERRQPAGGLRQGAARRPRRAARRAAGRRRARRPRGPARRLPHRRPPAVRRGARRARRGGGPDRRAARLGLRRARRHRTRIPRRRSTR